MTKVMLIKDRNTLNCRWLCDFANLLVDRGYQVHIVCDSVNKAGHCDYLNAQIEVTNLSTKTKNPLINFWYRIRRHFTLASFRYAPVIRKSKPDIILCYFPKDLFNSHFFHNYGIPVIQMVHGEPQRIFKKLASNRLEKLSYMSLFKRVNVFQVLTQKVQGQIAELYPVNREVVIPNPVAQIDEDKQTDLSQEKGSIVYLARVEKGTKRQHLLVDAFSKIAKDFPNWHIDFFGEMKAGAYSEEMMKTAKENGIADRIFFHGYTQDIQSAYRNADINAFPSVSEGFALGLADGMAHGLPSIGFATTSSVNEMIKDGENGFLVNSVDEFAEKLALLMKDKDLRIRFGKQAVQDMKPYAPKNIMDAWDKLIKETISSHKK